MTIFMYTPDTGNLRPKLKGLFVWCTVWGSISVDILIWGRFSVEQAMHSLQLICGDMGNLRVNGGIRPAWKLFRRISPPFW
jgi:hypothetical protein